MDQQTGPTTEPSVAPATSDPVPDTVDGAPAAQTVTAAGAKAEGAADAGGEPAAAPDVDPQLAAEALGVPLYPGARVASAIVSSSDGGGGAIVTLETPAPPAEVIGFYRERTAQAGYALKAEVNAGTMRMIGAEKSDRALTIQVVPKAGGGSTVALQAGGR